MLKVKSPIAASLLGRADAIKSAADDLALALVGRDAAPPDPGSTVFSIAGLCAAHECLDDGALIAAREVIRLEGHHRTDDVVARLVCLVCAGRYPTGPGLVTPPAVTSPSAPDKAYRHAESLLAVLGEVPVWLETAKANEQESGTPSQRQ